LEAFKGPCAAVDPKAVDLVGFLSASIAFEGERVLFVE
jgi:hypothetical protein